MKTRSQINYSNINVKDFYLLHQVQKIIHTCKLHKKNDDPIKKHDKLGTVLLFDIESYELKVNTKEKSKWIPHQISWGIYRYNTETKKLEKYKTRNYYVSEIWVHPKYRTQIETKYQKSYKQHLSNVTHNAYPLKNAYQIVSQMLKDIKNYSVNTLASYNIYSDFKMLNNLVQSIPMNKNIPQTQFDYNYLNPFRDQSLQYCDIMHNVSILYMDYLIQEGFKDEKIFRNAATKQIKLRGRNNSKSIYSAEYILDKFFGEKQKHLADDDVELESKMLEKIINDKGVDALELNVMYPVKLYNQFSQKILEKHSLKIQTAYLYTKNPSTINSRTKLD